MHERVSTRPAVFIYVRFISDNGRRMSIALNIRLAFSAPATPRSCKSIKSHPRAEERFFDVRRMNHARVYVRAHARARGEGRNVSTLEGAFFRSAYRASYGGSSFCSRYTRALSSNTAETHIFIRCSGRFHLCTRRRTL